MSFDPKAYGAEVAAILALDGGGKRLMPLAGGQCSSTEALALLKAAAAHKLFPRSRSPEAALAGLYLYFSCWAEAHQVAQDIQTAEGSYWHALVHRQEPDAFNAGYWFRRVGDHAIFPALRRYATGRGINFGLTWDPIAFIDYCGKARPGSEDESKARDVQRAEWQLLFDHCARVVKHASA